MPRAWWVFAAATRVAGPRGGVFVVGVGVRKVREVLGMNDEGAQVVPIAALRRRRRERDLEPWVGTREVAEHLGRSVKTVQRYVVLGLPHQRPFRDRGRLLFRLSEVDRWMKERSQ